LRRAALKRNPGGGHAVKAQKLEVKTWSPIARSFFQGQSLRTAKPCAATQFMFYSSKDGAFL
jgi:hypothetical protein